ncbi:hypothetical protein [Pseudomonas entomophila]|uniref:Uncharacterized protein n=1 Tax=Pseudomonas entomophila TaxID=312306 RepID=A0ABY9QJF0_9PSED|nr:hypothetical protein [Pseudomonas entomophila]WMW04166.1 hypothetical protein RAH46_17735 [Pseudomonas entomophila]
MRTHFATSADLDDIEQAPCGTWLGEHSQLSGNWARVDCLLCQKRKENITRSAQAEEHAIIEQMGEMAECMRADSAEQNAKQAFRDYCDRCAEIVSTWPVWKREAIKSPPVPAVVCRPGINCGKCFGCASRARGKQS